MGKTKTTSSKLPRGYPKSQAVIRDRKHFDSVDSTFSEEHYGKYLVVKNTASNQQDHNRYYLNFETHLEFQEFNMSRKGPLVFLKNNGITDTQLLSRFPEQHDFIWSELTLLIEEFTSRRKVEVLLRGFGHLLSVFNKYKIALSSLEELDGDHLETLENDAKEGAYSRTTLKNCTGFLRLTIACYRKMLHIPALDKYGVQTSGKDELSLAVSWQCDIYACQELDKTIQRVNEYRGWMRELKEMQAPFHKEELAHHGGLFTMKNLVFTVFDNFDTFGGVSGNLNKPFYKAIKQLYDIDLKDIRERAKQVGGKEAEIRKLGEGGVNITVNDERMFAIWHKVIAPEYPFKKTILPQYAFVQASLQHWRTHKSGSCGISLVEFDRRIIPDFQALYPLYLFSLCRSGLNQQPVLDWRVWMDEFGNYHLGEDSGMGRIVDGYKGRGLAGGSIQSTALDSKQCEYMEFWCDYAAPIYHHTADCHFFQYEEMGDVSILTTESIKSILRQGKSHFFYRNCITDMILLKDGTPEEKRLYTIDHNKIRKIKNLSEYLEGKRQWERQYERGHQDVKTGITYEMTAEFQGSKQHRIAKTLNVLVEYFRGRISSADNPKLEVFNGPLAHCHNPFEPDYVGAKKLRKNDVCTNWRKCLSECSQCQPVKQVHGPNIMAWRIVMEELRPVYADTKDWERMFLLDDMAAEAALKACEFSDEEQAICEAKANEPGRLMFIRKEVLNSQRSRRLSEEELKNG